MSTITEAPAAALLAAVRTAPKAELHLHLEGTLEPEMAFALAQRHGVALRWPDAQALRAAYAFDDLQAFLDLYYAGCDVLRSADDFFELAWAYCRRAAADGVVRAEVFIDPQSHTARGVDFAVFMPALARAAQRARDELDLSVDYIVCALRHLSEDDALAMLEASRPWAEHYIGVGLDSSERGHPPGKFTRLFARAAELGLRRVAHAGEEGPAAYVAEALDALGVERIDHGVRALDDAAVLERLARERVPLTVCPLSNVRLRVYPDMAAHRLPELLRAGIVATVHSDDPAYFGGYVNDNYTALFEAHPQLGADDAYRLLRNGLQASFAPTAQVERWIARLDAHWRRCGYALPA